MRPALWRFGKRRANTAARKGLKAAFEEAWSGRKRSRKDARRIPAKHPGSEAPFLAGANAARGRGTLSRCAEVGGWAAAAPGLCSAPVQASRPAKPFLFYFSRLPILPPPPPPSLPTAFAPFLGKPEPARPSDHGAREVSKPLRRSPGQTEGRGQNERGEGVLFSGKEGKKIAGGLLPGVHLYFPPSLLPALERVEADGRVPLLCSPFR